MKLHRAGKEPAYLAQLCLDCGTVLTAAGCNQISPGDVFECHGEPRRFLSRESPDLPAGSPAVIDAKRCRPTEKTVGVITHRVVAVPARDSQVCIDCSKTLGGPGSHFPPGEVGECFGNGLNPIRPCRERSRYGKGDDQGPRWRG